MSDGQADGAHAADGATERSRDRASVVVTGATGLIGTALVSALRERGDRVVVLTRSPEAATGRLGAGVETHPWPSPSSEPPAPAALAGADAVVHLLGETVAQRWSQAAKREIRDSRVSSTRLLVDAIAALPTSERPAALISQSATGYYGAHGAEPLDEDTPAGDGFLAELTRAWEQEALRAAERSHARVVLTRTGVVLSGAGGALARMLPPFRLGLGGPIAGGRQYVPWIHLDDVVGALLRCLDDERAAGPFNLTAPAPATNSELAHALGEALHRPAALPLPAGLLRLIYGEMASILIDGQRAIPSRLLELGYSFTYADLRAALRQILGDT